jgi:putative lipase involved disintegration of autophagic bodies
MATVENYVDIANAVYAKKGGAAVNLEGWTVQKWEWATWYGNGYQGGVFADHNDVIVGFSGTQGDLFSAPVSQNTGNFRIGINVIPNMSGSAFAMVNWARANAHGRQVSMCGHSLGGGLAQVVGNWSGLPFISFNGPGMASHLKMSAFNLFKPQQMVRSATSKNTSDTVGICFTVRGDFVGEFGAHVGHEVVVDARGIENKHSMDAIISGIGMEKLRTSPQDFLSIWPSPPVVGRARR